MIRILRPVIVAMTLAAMLTATQSGADTAATAKPSDTTEITIFAKQAPARHSYAGAQAEMANTDPHFACALYLKNRPKNGYKRAPFVDGPSFGGAPPNYDVNGGFTDDSSAVGGSNPDAKPDDASDANGNANADPNVPDNLNCSGVARIDRRMQILIHDKNMPEAYAAYEAGDYPKALELFIKAYNKLSVITSPQNRGEVGQADTFRAIPALAVMVGRMYLYGQGTPPDTAKAIEWFKKAANEPTSPDLAGDVNFMSSQAEGALYLARIYETGTDVPVNPKEARHWYLRAADLNYVPALHLCGLIYRSGYGGEHNMAKAMEFFLKAGGANYAPAQYTLGEIYYFGQDGIKEDKMRAGAWLLKAARLGYPDALFAVGRMYDLGEGGATVDPQKALIYYKEAALKRQPDAEEAIALSFYTGNGVPKDLTAARLWFGKAAEDANTDAMFNLAVMLINGEGGDKDLVKAWVWLKIADAGGNANARTAMAELEPKMTPDELAKARALFAPAS